MPSCRSTGSPTRIAASTAATRSAASCSRSRLAADVGHHTGGGSTRSIVSTRSMDRSKDTIVPTPVVSAQATRYASAKSTRSVSYTSQLLDVIEEAEHALLEQRRGALVVAGQAVVSEQVSVARIQEQLRPLYRLVELAGGFEVFVRRQRPFVGVHDVDLERDALRPRAAELRQRDATVEQQGSLRTGPCLGQHLRRHRAQREPGIDDLVRQAVRGHSTALDDRVEADLLRVLHAVGELREGLAVVEIREVHDVSGSPELVGERQASGRRSLCMMEEQNLSHVAAA